MKAFALSLAALVVISVLAALGLGLAPKSVRDTSVVGSNVRL